MSSHAFNFPLRRAVALVMLLAAPACRQPKAQESTRAPVDFAAPVAVPADSSDAPVRLQFAKEGGRGLGASQPVDPVSHLAYAYAMTLELPDDRLVGVMDAHVAACRDAGRQLCQLVASSRNDDPFGRVVGAVSVRAEPEWLSRFMKGAQNDALGANGRLTAQSTTAEDLTRQIIDTEATLRAKRTLRDRLQQVLATRPGSLADLLSAEHELARVLGEIDSIDSNLTAMRTRVSMSALTIDYVSSTSAVANGTFEPLRLAFLGFIAAVVGSTAELVSLVAGLLPWVIAAATTLWVGLAIRRRRARASQDSRAPGVSGFEKSQSKKS